MTRQEFKKLRKLHGPTQPAFAKFIGMSKAAIGAIETARMPITDETVRKVNDAIAKGPPSVIVERQTDPTSLGIVQSNSIPMTIRLTNGTEIMIKANLKTIIKQLGRA